MTRSQAREAARDILKIVPVVMRTVAAELRKSGELPAPAHFGLLAMVKVQPRTLTELATLQGVSLPTMSNSVSAMVQRGWVKRSSPDRDRRVAIIELTEAGREALERVGRAAEVRLSEQLQSLDDKARRRLQSGLAVLTTVFSAAPLAACPPERPRKRTKVRTSS